MTSDFVPEHSSKRSSESPDETILYLDDESLAIRINAHKTLAKLEDAMDPELRKNLDALIAVHPNPSIYLIKFVEFAKNPSAHYQKVLQESRMFHAAGNPHVEKALAPVEIFLRKHGKQREEILRQILAYIEAKFLGRERPIKKKRAA